MGEYRRLFVINIHRLMDNKGWSSNQLAEKLEVGRATISRWINGHNVPSEDLFDRLQETFNVQMAEFFRPMSKARAKKLLEFVEMEEE